MGAGRDEATVNKFFELLGEKRSAEIAHTEADSARWIINAVANKCPQAVQCTDPFHVAAWATDALDQFRRERWNNVRKRARTEPQRKRGRLPADAPPQPGNDLAKGLKGARYALWKNPENLTDSQRAKLGWVAKTDSGFTGGYLLKEALGFCFKLKGQAGKDALERWLSWAQWCRIDAFAQLGRKIRRHRAAINAKLEHGLFNALIESTNTKVRVLTRMAYGFKTPESQIALALLSMGSCWSDRPGRTPTKSPTRTTGEPVFEASVLCATTAELGSSARPPKGHSLDHVYDAARPRSYMFGPVCAALDSNDGSPRRLRQELNHPTPIGSWIDSQRPSTSLSLMHADQSFTVLVPTLDEAERIRSVVKTAYAAGAKAVVVVDGGSTDNTPSIATAAGACVLLAQNLDPGGISRGKGDSLWRALPSVTTPYTVFLDGDLIIEPSFILELVRPLFEDGKRFSKANFTRVDLAGRPTGPGRISRRVATPLLARFFPELAQLNEPLSGQIAAPTSILMGLPFQPDYGLEAGMLLDVHSRFGMSAISHPDCGALSHLSQGVAATEWMARQVASAILMRSSARPLAIADEAPLPPHVL